MAAVHANFMRFAFFRAADDGQPRHRTDGRQRLAAKTHRHDVRKIVVSELGSGMALDGEKEIVRLHAFAIVFHQHQIATAVGRCDVDACRARIERVLDEFFDGAGGTLHHLARGDAVDRAFRKTANFHGPNVADGAGCATPDPCAINRFKATTGPFRAAKTPQRRRSSWTDRRGAWRPGVHRRW